MILASAAKFKLLASKLVLSVILGSEIVLPPCGHKAIDVLTPELEMIWSLV